MKKIIIIVIIIVAALASSLSAYLANRNSYVPDEERMAEILADIYIADAISQERGSKNGVNQKKETESAYRTVLNHYGIDKAQYDSAIAWYSHNLEDYAKVYELTVEILSKKEIQYQRVIAQRDSIRTRIAVLNDSIRQNLWPHSNNLHWPLLPEDSLNLDRKNLAFEINLDSLRGGEITLFQKYNFTAKNKLKKSPKMQMIVVYNDTIADTCYTHLVLSRIQKQSTIKKAVRDSIPALQLKVDLAQSDDMNDIDAAFINIALDYMPYEITDSMQFDEIQLPPLFNY